MFDADSRSPGDPAATRRRGAPGPAPGTTTTATTATTAATAPGLVAPVPGAASAVESMLGRILDAGRALRALAAAGHDGAGPAPSAGLAECRYLDGSFVLAREVENTPVEPLAPHDPGRELVAELGGEPGLRLAERLASLELADLDDHTVVEVLAAWERVASWAQAGSARALSELLERTRNTSGHEFVADGVAARLGLSRRAAESHVTVAHGAARLPEVADALAGGLVDRRKAEVLVSAGRLPDDLRRVAVRELLPDLEHLTAAQIRARMRRAEIEVDPGGADERHECARRERFVRLEPVDDAMAYLTAYLPADDAARAFAAVDEVALAMRRSPGEERRLDECRADAFAGMLCGRVATGPHDDADPAQTTGRDPLADQGMSTGRAATTSRAPRGAGVRVSVAASTLLGADDLPASLDRYGPIPAGMARAIAGDPDAVWQRIFTDPGTGVLTDTSSRAYRPSAALRAAVVARDVTCTFPGCRVPATGCDLDHVEPFDPTVDGPQTRGENLHALCRTHHRAKTIGGWRVTRHPTTGVTRWLAPTGHPYGRPPETAARPESPGLRERLDEEDPPP